MKGSWHKVIFWAAICVSSAVFVFSTYVAARVIYAFLVELPLSERGPIEILNASVIALLPLLILFLTIRAIRFRGAARPILVIVRALYPLVPLALVIPYAMAIRPYLIAEDETTAQRLWTTGSVTYLCSTHSRKADYDPKTIGATELRLQEVRHPGRLSTWTVLWPGKHPIAAASFHAQIRSIGGTQGIKWREPDGRHTIAYLSFSDVVGPYGPGSIWVWLSPSDDPAQVLNPEKMRWNYTCGPDPATYHS